MCSTTCGLGEITRSRLCQTGCDYVTSDDLTQSQSCKDRDCPGKITTISQKSYFQYSVKAVLILRSLLSFKPTLIGLDGQSLFRFFNFSTNFSGSVDEDLNFEVGQEVFVDNGCSAILMGEMWYFGGNKANNYNGNTSYLRQVGF